MALEVTDETFAQEVLAADVPVLVDFTAPWCRPCRAIEPILDDLAAEHEGRVKLVAVDTDANLAVPSRYGVLTLPTVIVFVGGEPVATLLGASPKRRYAEALAPFLSGAAAAPSPAPGVDARARGSTEMRGSSSP